MHKSHARRSPSGSGAHHVPLLLPTLVCCIVAVMLAGQVGFRLGTRLAARCVLIHAHSAGNASTNGGLGQHGAGLPADALALPQQLRLRGGALTNAAAGGAAGAGAATAQQQEGQRQQEERQQQGQAQQGGGGGPQPRYAQWAPYRVTRCEPGMPKHWAPCLHVPGAKVLLAEETIYPPFQLREPVFLKQEHRDWFHNHRATYSWQFHMTRSTSPDEHNSEYLAFQTTNGQNWVFGNARYDSDPHPDGWNGENTMCMGHRVRVSQFREEEPRPGDERHDELMLANTPDGYSFQHHMDHATKLVAHAMHLITPQTDVLAMHNMQPQPVVRSMWGWWPQINESRVLFGGSRTRWAKRLIMPCRAQLVHPYPVQFHQASVLGANASAVPLAERKYVVIASRRNSANRVILNEDKMTEAINATLQARGQGEILLVMADQSAWPTYKDFALWMNRNVRAMVGIHGGMLENLFWLSPNTTLLEIVPSGTRQWGPTFYTNARALEMEYSAYPAQSVQGESVNVDPREVVQLLEQTLGKAPERPPLRHHYEWLEALTMAGRGIS